MAQTRITAGTWRGRVITTPSGPSSGQLRPTRSLVREALFNILGGDVENARFLDLYAGAGSVGFEALSRGAAHVTFVEKQRGALGCIAATVERFDCAERCDLIAADAASWLRRAGGGLTDFDICFLDAPYLDDSLLTVLDVLGRSPGPLVVCEHHRSRDIPAQVGRLGVVRRVRYGLTDLTFLRPLSIEDVNPT